LVAWSRHERKAETAFPPTTHTVISGLVSMAIPAAAERRRASKGRSRPPLAAVGLERVGGLKGKGGGGRDTDVPERILNRGGEGGMASQVLASSS
jgi:hypothetical protein